MIKAAIISLLFHFSPGIDTNGNGKGTIAVRLQNMHYLMKFTLFAQIFKARLVNIYDE